MAWFYGLYLSDERLEAALELIRFVGEPDYLRRPHITVRGPYERKQDALLERLAYSPQSVFLRGIAAFFSEKQNTVLLECDLPEKDRVWRKPDFPEGKPHITLYDGKSRNLALGLRLSLKQCKWRFRTEVRSLTLVERKLDPEGSLPAMFDNVSKLYREVMFEDFNVDKIRRFGEVDATFCVSRFATFISRHYPPDRQARGER
ncbi:MULTISPECIES: hypothetical protein [unclassified Bradyrhizobium]|uniref:hypothetical protein n=1 Tax=unclassified Bradyrhizobium TaxID=2631580 RepID=UPI0028ED3AD1|nr:MULTISPECIES: hypothetical protein [unclassified Bradyrhizobium]